LIVDGKNGMRRVRIIMSAPALSEWLRNHPVRHDPASPLWILTGNTNHGNPLTYAATVKLLRQTAKRARVRKAVNPHMFRHSRASHLATKLTEAQMKQYLGWTPGSDMAAVYVHLSVAWQLGQRVKRQPNTEETWERVVGIFTST